MPRLSPVAPRRPFAVALHSLFAGAALIALAIAAPALAQTAGTGGSASTSSVGGLTARALRVGGEDVDLGVTIKVGIEECNLDSNIDFELDGVPDGKSIDVYLGESCNQTSARDTDGTGDCDYIGNFKSELTRQQPVTIKTSALLGSDCDKETESMPKIWFLAVSTPKGSEDVKTLYTMLETLRLDTSAPAPPTGVKGGSGEKQIPVEWDASGSDLETFIVLIDPQATAGGGASGSGASGSGGGGADEDGGADDEPATGGGASSDGECRSSVLTPNGSIEGLPSSVRRKTINEATATGIDLSPNDIDGELAAVAVVAVDEAGNASRMSALACVKIVPTDGFWDRYQQEGDPVAGGCPCTAAGPAQLDTGWPVALALAFIARSARRRRRS